MNTEAQEAKILNGTATAREIRNEVAAECAELKQSHGVVPCLAVVLVGGDAASQIYVNAKAKAAGKAGMASHVERLPETVREDELLAILGRLNEDPAVHGILVQLPLPDHISEQKVTEAIDPQKDVDGFHPDNVGRLLSGLPGFVPCTPAGIIELLRRHEIPMAGRHAVVIGRSNIVGKPMAVLLLRENCTVTVCHSKTRDLPQVAALGDILIAAVGRPGMVTADFIRPGATVIDVGIHRVEDEATARELFGENAKRLASVREKGSTLVGDVHPTQARTRAGWISPVPGGVGPLTIALLLRNTLESARRAAGEA